MNAMHGRRMQPLRSGSIVELGQHPRSVTQQMRHHLDQGVHRSINPLYPLPFLTKDRQALLNSLDRESEVELVKMIVERHMFNKNSGGNSVDMRVSALDAIVAQRTRGRKRTEEK